LRALSVTKRSSANWMPQACTTMMGRAVALLVVSALALGGCGGVLATEEPPKAPTSEQLSRVAATTRQPAYWLGPSFRRVTVSSAAARRR
jgi:hypothetical protein